MPKEPIKVDIEDLREAVGGLTLAVSALASPVLTSATLLGHVSAGAGNANGTSMCNAAPVGPDAVESWVVIKG
jgi:hypothetical protein